MDLFERAGCGCYCNYWSFVGDHRDWQLRLAVAADENARALRAGLEAGMLKGSVACADGRVIGWSRLAAPPELGRLYDGRLYKGLPCLQGDRTSVLTIGCVLVAPEHRRRGVATAVLTAQVEYARTLGASAVEAFPRGAVDVSDEEQWMGPLAVFTALGFRTIHDFAPYPVLRKDL